MLTWLVVMLKGLSYPDHPMDVKLLRYLEGDDRTFLVKVSPDYMLGNCSQTGTKVPQSYINMCMLTYQKEGICPENLTNTMYS
jgi:hypothetical protein